MKFLKLAEGVKTFGAVLFAPIILAGAFLTFIPAFISFERTELKMGNVEEQ